MVWIGILSYSIYLWHQPLLAFTRITTPSHPPLALMAALALTTVPLAWVSWRFVEQPFRTRPAVGGFSCRTIFAASAAGLAIIIAIGAIPMTAPRLTEAFYMARLSDEEQGRYLVLQEGTNLEQKDAVENSADVNCQRLFELVTPEAEDMLLRCTEDGQRAVIATGGSHGQDLYNALALASGEKVLIGFARGFCRPHRSVKGPRPHECPFNGLRDLVAAYPDRMGLIVYTQADFTVFDEYRNIRSAEGLHEDLIEEVADYLETLALHVPVLALGPKPFLGVDPRRLSISEPLAQQIALAQDPGIAVAISAVDQAFAVALDERRVPYLSHPDAIGTLLPEEAILGG